MVNIFPKTFLGILVNEGIREDGSSEINGKVVSWKRAYILTVVEFGNLRGEAKKFTVLQEKEREISEKLSKVCWGSLVELKLENNRVSDVRVVLDWAEDIPVD